MFRVAHRLFSSSLRFSTRVNLNTAARSSRRMMSSESHASHGGSAPSDTPWIVRFADSVHRVKLLNVFHICRLGLRCYSVLWWVHTVDAACFIQTYLAYSFCTSCLRRRAKALMDTMAIKTTAYVATCICSCMAT